MKVTLNCLKQYVGFDWPPEELAERLTMLGLEVESVKKVGGDFEGIVVAQVITRDKHPNADKLSLCRVQDGQAERQIVCGADNFKPGDKVPLILPGAALPAKQGAQPFVIKVGKIRGVESHGMMCSPQELGLPDEIEGLLILREDAKVGQPFAEYLGLGASDVVYDLEITPNRPDLNSVIGIAREISAVTGNPLRLPIIPPPPAQGARSISEFVSVRIEDSELCPRYAARMVQGVKVGPSPAWLKQALEKVGVRSINNVVDVTNYVMLETGQPLHAFDWHLLAGGEAKGCPAIIIRRATEGDKFRTLDGQERTLTSQMLLITDGAKPVALAGVMGGQNSEINPSTVDVLIESACFNPKNIRATSKKLDLRTESSYRFERGTDVLLCEWASQRAAQLILETAGGTAVPGVLDEFPRPFEFKEIPLRHTQTNALLGLEVPMEKQIECLLGLGLEVASPAGVGPANATRTPHQTVFRAPSFRLDLKREVDLIEEVARLYGVDKIPATPPRGALGANPFDAMHDQLGEARRLLVGLGLFETQGQTLISESAARPITGAGVIPLANPLSGDMNVLRPSLVPGLLEALRYNISRRNCDLALFEIGRVFLDPAQSREERRLAIALTGQCQSLFWAGTEREMKFDIYDLKGVLEEFFDQFGLRGMTYARRSESTALLVESATIHLGKFQLGELGQLLPAIAKQSDLRDGVYLAELNLDLLLARRNASRSFKPLPAQPSIRRDVAMLVLESTTHEAVLQAVKAAKPANLESVDLFDVFRGQNVPPAHKSMAYAFTYRSPERSLTDSEVNASHEKLLASLKANLSATIRDAAGS